MDPGEAWAQVLPVSPVRWRRQDVGSRWNGLADVCGGAHLVGLLQQAWFNHEAARPASDPTIVLVPADLATAAVRDVAPVGLWWDTAPMLPH